MRIPKTLPAAIFLASAISAFCEKPNVLLICVDDLKPVLGCYGDTVVKSPNIDRLASRSTLFERAYCNQAVCAPSRHALITGLRPDTLGIYDLDTDFRLARPDAVTLPQVFQKAGYRTACLGKVLHGNRYDDVSWSAPAWTPDGPAYSLPESMASMKKGKRGARGTATECADVAAFQRSDDGGCVDECASTRIDEHHAALHCGAGAWLSRERIAEELCDALRSAKASSPPPSATRGRNVRPARAPLSTPPSTKNSST